MRDDGSARLTALPQCVNSGSDDKACRPRRVAKAAIAAGVKKVSSTARAREKW
jgi:hypothetical protein